MELDEAVERLESSDTYQEFMDKNPDYYLVHAFNMEEQNWDDWQFGYYEEESDTIVAFHMGKEIERAPEDDVLKEDGSVEELDLDSVEVTPGEAVETAQKYQESEYPQEHVTKTILILQSEDGQQLYNITLVTQSFELLNLKVDASTGEIDEETKESIMDLGSPM